MNTAPTPPILEQEEDIPNIKNVVAIAIGTAVTFAIGVFIVVWMMRGSPRAGRLVPPYPRALGQPEVGLVDQPMFEGDRRRADFEAAQRERLNEYGWVDRDAGVIHIPIEQAMDRLVAAGAIR